MGEQGLNEPTARVLCFYESTFRYSGEKIIQASFGSERAYESFVQVCVRTPSVLSLCHHFDPLYMVKLLCLHCLMMFQGHADDAVRGYGLSALLGDKAAQACPHPNLNSER